jgi:FkbM family methyltransferase
MQELEFLADIVRPQSVILEVGANIGNHAIFYEKYINPAKVILIGPNPDVIQLLRKNIEMNGCIEMDTSLLGIVAGKKRNIFFMKDIQIKNLGSAYLESNPDGNIQVATLDEIIHEKIDFMKIDVDKM